MEFEIGFSYNLARHSSVSEFSSPEEVRKAYLREIGAYRKEPIKEPYNIHKWYIEVKDFKSLKKILTQVDDLADGEHSAIISFDPPSIFLDECY